MPKHFFFDLDNTLTPSKALILERHVPTFMKLCAAADVIVVSGHGDTDIKKHLLPETEGKYFIMGQNGNRAERKDGTVLWNRSLSEDRKAAILSFITKAQEHLKLKVKDEHDLIEDRDSQIAYSLIGHHEDSEIKKAFDPRHEIRLKLLNDLAGDVSMLRDAGVEVRSGGTTVLDFFELGKNKGYNVAAFISTMGWSTHDCLYMGDALFPGGNDETVIGIIPTHAVDGPDDTFTFINKMLS